MAPERRVGDVGGEPRWYDATLGRDRPGGSGWVVDNPSTVPPAAAATSIMCRAVSAGEDADDAATAGAGGGSWLPDMVRDMDAEDAGTYAAAFADKLQV